MNNNENSMTMEFEISKNNKNSVDKRCKKDFIKEHFTEAERTLLEHIESIINNDIARKDKEIEEYLDREVLAQMVDRVLESAINVQFVREISTEVETKPFNRYYLLRTITNTLVLMKLQSVL